MTQSKIYLNVPYAQKDAAKALGARWDPANKKWYVPGGKSIEPFAQWRLDAEAQGMLSKPTGLSPTNAAGPIVAPSKPGASGVFTYAGIADFVAYS
ncbi:MAG: DUF5710 domain-containing protein, partial [Methylomonas sp.]|nr:DUF5710 domain-containing protein [Methylomonas sp.]